MEVTATRLRIMPDFAQAQLGRYEDIETDVGYFASSQSHDADNFSDATPPIALSIIYEDILARLETLVADQGRSMVDGGFELDNLLLQLRLWATDIRADTGSLYLIDSECHDEAVFIRIHFQNVLSLLKDFDSEDISHDTLGDSKLRM